MLVEKAGTDNCVGQLCPARGEQLALLNMSLQTRLVHTMSPNDPAYHGRTDPNDKYDANRRHLVYRCGIPAS